MEVPAFFFAFFILLYTTALVILLRVWARIPRTKTQTYDQHNKFSVLVPFRNEYERIDQLLESLKFLDYPANAYEVLFIDDGSVDQTVDRIIMQENYRIIHLPEGKQGKKQALEYGVSQAEYSCIVTTDADCTIPKNWLRCYDEAFQNGNPVFISAPVALDFNRGSLAQVMQYFEQTALTAIGGISIALGRPTMCNGANIGFRKKAFIAVNGYAGNDHIPTGDDQFLLKKMAQRYPKHISFLRSAKAVVQTQAAPDWSELIGQRVRWASKWKETGGWLALAAVFIALTYISVLGLIGLAMYWDNSLRLPVLLILTAKMIADAWFVFRTGWSRIPAHALLWWPLVQLFYPFYALYIGLRATFQTSYSWKGRQYSAMG